MTNIQHKWLELINRINKDLYSYIKNTGYAIIDIKNNLINKLKILIKTFSTRRKLKEHFKKLNIKSTNDRSIYHTLISNIKRDAKHNDYLNNVEFYYNICSKCSIL